MPENEEERDAPRPVSGEDFEALVKRLLDTPPLPHAPRKGKVRNPKRKKPPEK